MARFDWVRLVCPLFLAAAVANACTSAAGSKGDVAAGAAAGETMTEPGGSGGNAGQPGLEPGGSGGDAGDGPANAVTCPQAPPIAGSQCAHTADFGANGCHYAPPPPDCAPLIATCSSLGSWNVRLEPDYGDDTCSEDPESSCPDSPPALGSACQFQGTVCQYNPGSVVVCSLCDTWLAGKNGVDCDGAGGAGGAPP